MEKYPDSVYQMYELIVGFTEEMDNFYDRLKNEEEKMLKKINALMAEPVADRLEMEATEALAQQALDNGAAPLPATGQDAQTPFAAITKQPPRYWDEQQRIWTDRKPVKKSELDLF